MPETSASAPVNASSKPWQALSKLRKAAGRSVKDCARYIGVSVRRYQGYESGSDEISLPEAEQLSYFLNVPIDALTGEAEWQDAPPSPNDVKEFMELRARIIGARLRLARLQLDLDLPALARETGLRVAEIGKYELAARPIPITKLNLLARHLGISREDLLRMEGDTQARTREQLETGHALFDKLPDDVREFMLDPEALSALRSGMRLRGFARKDLRKVARALQKLAAALAK